MTYDSRPDTYEHIQYVQAYLQIVAISLLSRGLVHDQSKLVSPEVEVFDEFTPKLASTTYGSPEYKASLEGMGEGLRHHYAANDHHPEHHPNGIADMDLIQLTELICDWKAATLRHPDGDLRASIEQNAERFGYGPELKRLLLNTADTLERLGPQ